MSLLTLFQNNLARIVVTITPADRRFTLPSDMRRAILLDDFRSITLRAEPRHFRLP
jgi:hypothetical protein